MVKGEYQENKHFIHLDPDRDENIAHIVTGMNIEVFDITLERDQTRYDD
jgi:hypothetical protein